MKAVNIQWDADEPEEIEGLPDTIEIPTEICSMKHKDEIRPDFNFLMNYTTGKPKEWWYGIQGIKFIWMGAWNDPLIEYGDYVFNSHDIEDVMWDNYSETSGSSRKTPDDEFEKYMKENSRKVLEMLDEIIEKNLEAISDYITDETGFCHGGFCLSA